MRKRHRIFIAINLPSEIKKYLWRLQSQWQDVPANWVPPENLHITVVFLGDIDDQQLGQVCLAVKEVIAQHQTFAITLEKIAFGPEGKIPPRYIWAGSQGYKELEILKKDLETALSEHIHLSIDRRPFAPHVTLAKIKEFQWRGINPEERPEVHQDLSLEFTVESIEVMESELKREGPKYTVIESHQLL